MTDTVRENIKSIFTLFSGEVYDESEHLMFLDIAIDETTRMLLPDVTEWDMRLIFLCAAIMNYRFRQALSAADRSAYTYAGKMNSEGDKKLLGFSEALLRDYIRLCADVIKCSDFVFMGFS